jgi:RNA polymerase sigma factor (sigma-70 family)
LPTQYSDRELILACSKGQAWAWDALVDRYKALVYSVALRAGLSQQDAADVFQTVFARLVEHLGAIRAPQGLAAWLITTTRREAWSLLRKQRREPAGEEVPAMLAAADQWRVDPRPDESRLVDHILIREGLAQMGERCSKLLWLLYFEPSQPSYEEIGRQLRMPTGSVGPTRARCLEKLRQILRAMGMSGA